MFDAQVPMGGHSVPVRPRPRAAPAARKLLVAARVSGLLSVFLLPTSCAGPGASAEPQALACASYAPVAVLEPTYLGSASVDTPPWYPTTVTSPKSGILFPCGDAARSAAQAQIGSRRQGRTTGCSSRSRTSPPVIATRESSAGTRGACSFRSPALPAGSGLTRSHQFLPQQPGPATPRWTPVPGRQRIDGTAMLVPNFRILAGVDRQTAAPSSPEAPPPCGTSSIHVQPNSWRKP